jgi:hypothetical protein
MTHAACLVEWVRPVSVQVDNSWQCVGAASVKSKIDSQLERKQKLRLTAVNTNETASVHNTCVGLVRLRKLFAAADLALPKRRSVWKKSVWLRDAKTSKVI